MFEEISRGYLPENYYIEQQVYRRKPPRLVISHYPNKIEVGGEHRCYAILVKKASHAKLHFAYAWMSTHPYIMLKYLESPLEDNSQLTGNIVVEAYECLSKRNYAMVAFRAATIRDEQTNHIMQSHGGGGGGEEGHENGATRRSIVGGLTGSSSPCPPPAAALLCRSGVNLQSVWQWLSLHHGRLAYVVDEPLIRSTIALVRPSLREGELLGYIQERQQQFIQSYRQYATYDEFNTRRTRNLNRGNSTRGGASSDASLQQYMSRQLPSVNGLTAAPSTMIRRPPSHESVDSALPTYEPPPPSIHSSLVEDPQAEVAAEQVDNNISVHSPPAYWDVADQTEYGRSFASRLAARVFGSSSECVVNSVRRDSHISGMSYCGSSARLSLSSRRNLTRTFTQSMPSLVYHLASNEDAVAMVEESRRQALATASVSNNPQAIQIVRHTINTSSTNGSSSSSSTGWRLRLQNRFAEQRRRSRLFVKTNPEYGSSGRRKSANWLTRLLNM